METILFIGLIALVFFYTVKKKGNPRTDPKKAHYDEMDRVLAAEGFTETGEIYYIPRFKDEDEDLDQVNTWDYRKHRYYPDCILKIDKEHDRFAFCDAKSQMMFHFGAGEVLSCRVLEDDQVLMSQMLSRKAMERAMKERHGAPSGKVKSLQIEVVVDREKGPVHVFSILSRPMERTELEYKNAVRFVWQMFWLMFAAAPAELPEDTAAPGIPVQAGKEEEPAEEREASYAPAGQVRRGPAGVRARR
ncbi:MAG: hypothetical protein Q4C22_01955 [Bacillota bacterium]|nr:hypothetical protein [Bacillota bacterium]